MRRRKTVATGALATAVREALTILDTQKAAGVPFDERIKGLDGVIRQFWPFTREWKDLCHDCHDYGLVMRDCPGDATCGRRQPHLPHDFGVPCRCEKGRRYRPPAPPAPEDYGAAGKRKKSGLKPVGRWEA